MNAGAEIAYRDGAGAVRLFVAEHAEVHGPWITATGYRRERTSAGFIHYDRETVTWPAKEVRRIRWTDQSEAVAA